MQTVHSAACPPNNEGMSSSIKAQAGLQTEECDGLGGGGWGWGRVLLFLRKREMAEHILKNIYYIASTKHLHLKTYSIYIYLFIYLHN